MNASCVVAFEGDINNPDECLNCVKKWESIERNFYFLLSNDIVGASFTDSTTMLHDQKTSSFRYIVDCQEDDFFKEGKIKKLLKKKVQLLKEFEARLEKEATKTEKKEPEDKKQALLGQKHKDTNNIYTNYPVSWLCRKHVTIFKFDNSAIEAFFKDKTILLINPHGKLKKVLYWDKENQLICFETLNLEKYKQASQLSSLSIVEEVQMKINYLARCLEEINNDKKK